MSLSERGRTLRSLISHIAERVNHMTDLQPQPLPPRSTVRITAPISVLNDLDKFQRAQASILGKAGCPACTSGLDLHWQALVDFEVDHAGNVRQIAADELVG
jgi:hypothetical protein